VYIDETGAVLGTTGLYQYKRDAQEAVWVGWFCVDPKARGKGIGQKLIEHTICLAVQAGFRRVRLYTSTDPNEEAAQRLYEKNGFKEISRKKGLFATKLFREREIKQAEQNDALNSHACGTFGTSPAEQALVPESSGDT
jgi:RimJ/RimL family protein N-acetyltransferase